MINSIFNWSGGKDSALALHHVLQDKNIRIDRLMTTVNAAFGRISMHGVRQELLQAQADAIGIRVDKLMIPEMPSMTTYNQLMASKLHELSARGITHSIFGDIFLEDLKQYREGKLAEVGMKGLFPLWKRNTTELIEEFLDLGFKTIVVCTKADLLPAEFAGRVIDKDFLKDLPSAVDPCGENGEFHTFVFDGPIFKQPVPYSLGEKVFRTYEAPKKQSDRCFTKENKIKEMGFYFQDLTLLPNDTI